MIKIVITVGVALALGFIAGSAAVYTFNRIPDGWLGADEEGRDSQRVKSVPWKYVLSATFIVCGIYMGLKDPVAAPAVFAACFFLVQTAMAAKLYRRAPLPLSALVLVCGIASVSREADFQRYVIEAVAVIACLGALFGIVSLLRKRKGTGLEGAVPMSENFALAASAVLLCGGIHGITVIAASVCLWLVRVFMTAGRIGKERAFAEAEPPAFFLAACAALWMTVNISHAVI